MHEYIFAFSVVLVNDSMIITGLKSKCHSPTTIFGGKPVLDYKWIRVLKDNNLKGQILIVIDHNRNDSIHAIVEKVKEEIISRIKYFKNSIESYLGEINWVGVIYSFAIAPKDDRWDITGITTHDLFNHGLEIVKNFNREKAEIFVSVKEFTLSYHKDIEKEIQEKALNYIDEQAKLTIKNYG